MGGRKTDSSLPYLSQIAYHLSEEARNGIKEFTLPPIFQRELFDFQQNAVKIVARHLNNDRRRGAMIGDVVGLGKTITACAVAKIYEMTYATSTLIICPANLQEMWRKYIRKYDLKAEVMSMSKVMDIDNMRYFRLIIVDESHNLRNAGKRYNQIRQLIERQSSRVLLLTATPYNKHYSDLSNQLRLSSTMIKTSVSARSVTLKVWAESAVLCNATVMYISVLYGLSTKARMWKTGAN
ncbi:SNF2-related protein [Bacteroides fragilis]